MMTDVGCPHEKMLLVKCGRTDNRFLAKCCYCGKPMIANTTFEPYTEPADNLGYNPELGRYQCKVVATEKPEG